MENKKDMLPTPEERKAMLERIWNMSPEERAMRKKEREEFLQTLTPEQRAEFLARQEERRIKFQAKLRKHWEETKLLERIGDRQKK